MNLAAGTAGAGIAHFPEIVMLVSGQDMVLREVAAPGLEGLRVKKRPVFLRALENCGIEFRPVNLIHLCKQLPGPVDRLILEVIAEAPVAEHLEHGMMAAIVADRLEVIVLAAYAEAFLRVRSTGVFRG